MSDQDEPRFEQQDGSGAPSRPDPSPSGQQPGPQSGPPPGPVRDLSPRQTITETYGALFGRIPALSRLMALPLLLQTAIYMMVLSGIEVPGSMEEGLTPEQQAAVIAQLISISIPLLVMTMLPMAVLGYGWMRLLLLGEGAAPRLWPGDIKTVFKLFFALLGIMILSSVAGVIASNLIALPLAAMAGPMLFVGVSLTALGVMLWLMLRLGMILPARALGESYSLRDAWRQTKGQGSALLSAGIATLVPVYLLGLALTFVFPGSLGLVAAALSTLLVQAAFFALLASAFRQISGWVPQN